MKKTVLSIMFLFIVLLAGCGANQKTQTVKTSSTPVSTTKPTTSRYVKYEEAFGSMIAFAADKAPEELKNTIKNAEYKITKNKDRLVYIRFLDDQIYYVLDKNQENVISFAASFKKDDPTTDYLMQSSFELLVLGQFNTEKPAAIIENAKPKADGSDGEVQIVGKYGINIVGNDAEYWYLLCLSADEYNNDEYVRHVFDETIPLDHSSFIVFGDDLP